MSEQYDREILLNTPVSIQDYVVSVTELPLVTPFNLPFGAIDTRPSAWLRVSGSVNDDHKAYGAAEGTSLPLPIPLYDDCSTNLARNVGRILVGIKNSRLTLPGAH